MGFLLCFTSGFVSREPEIVTFQSNKDNSERKLVKVGMGVHLGFGDRQTTTWVDVIAYENSPNFNFMSQFVKKGDNLVVEGDLNVRAYQGKDGPATSITINAVTVDRPSRAMKPEDGEGAGSGEEAPAAAPQQSQAQQPRQNGGQPQQRQGAPAQRAGGPQQRQPVRQGQGGAPPQRGAATAPPSQSQQRRPTQGNPPSPVTGEQAGQAGEGEGGSPFEF